MRAKFGRRFILYEFILVGLPGLCAASLWIFEIMEWKCVVAFFIVLGLNMYFLPGATICPSGFTSVEFSFYPSNALGLCAVILPYTALAFTLAWLTTRRGGKVRNAI